MSEISLITTYNFDEQAFLIKMIAFRNSLEIVATNKATGEEWECTYDATYIENLTHKTGNFKKFDVFVCMLKSGLLKTSDSISLDLLTYDDLEQLRTQKLKHRLSRTSTNSAYSNRRYLILRYCVEFDRIHYPVPLDYCGPPDPALLQSTILKLQKELEQTKANLNACETANGNKKNVKLQKQIGELASENQALKRELQMLKQSKGKHTTNQVKMLQKAISNLERSVLLERSSHHKLVTKLRSDKFNLIQELTELRKSERILKNKLNKIGNQNGFRNFNYNKTNFPQEKSDHSLKTVYRRKTTPNMHVASKQVVPIRVRSLSSPIRGQQRRHDLQDDTSRSSSVSRCSYSSNASKTKHKVRSRSNSVTSNYSATDGKESKSSRNKNQTEEPLIEELQKKIKSLQKMFENGETCES